MSYCRNFLWYNFYLSYDIWPQTIVLKINYKCIKGFSDNEDQRFYISTGILHICHNVLKNVRVVKRALVLKMCLCCIGVWLNADPNPNPNPALLPIIAMTSYWVRLRLKTPASRMFAQPLIQAQIKENIKAPRHWPLWGEFNGDRWIPPTKGQ